MHVQSFEPNVRVAYTFNDYLNVRDPLQETALTLIKAQRRTDSG